MRVAIIGSRGYPYVYSGYETFVAELSERLVQRGLDVTVYCHKNLFSTRPAEVNGIRLIYIPTIERKTLSQFVHSFQAFIHASLKKYDVILAVNSANGPFGFFPRLFGKRTAINVDGLEWLRPKWKGLGGRYFYRASRWATRLFDVIITDSLEMRKIYEKEFNCSSTMIAYGANIPGRENPDTLKKWGLSPFQYYLIVGRLIPDNNADLIVGEYLRSDSRRKLVVVGDVPYRDAFASRLRNLGKDRLLFTGYIRDPHDLHLLYQHCFAYFHGHEFGGTNPTLLHALANSCAICALDTVFNREVLQQGEYGSFFSKEKGDLQKWIAEVEKNPDQLLPARQKAPQRILENYTWEKITGQYCQLFADLLKR